MKYVRQLDSMQCGVACLSMICNHYGKNVSIRTLSNICFASNEGVSLKGLSDAATKIGFNTYSYRMEICNLTESNIPCILHWNQKHFVVLYKIKNYHYYIADPGRGKIIYTEEEFKHHWISTVVDGKDMGIALFLKPELAFYKKVEGEANTPRSFSFLLSYVKQYRQYFGQIVLGLLVGCVLQLIFPFLTQAIVDIGITHKNINFIWLTGRENRNHYSAAGKIRRIRKQRPDQYRIEERPIRIFHFTIINHESSKDPPSDAPSCNHSIEQLRPGTVIL